MGGVSGGSFVLNWRGVVAWVVVVVVVVVADDDG